MECAGQSVFVRRACGGVRQTRYCDGDQAPRLCDRAPEQTPPCRKFPLYPQLLYGDGSQWQRVHKLADPKFVRSGSSAAVTVATLCAINDEFQLGKTREEIADMAFEIEKKVQKGRASPTDTTVSSYGGIVLITGSSRRRLPPQNLQIVIGDTLVSHNTSKMVEQVSDLKKKHPDIVGHLLDAIEGVSLNAIHHLDNPRELGRYMDMNHALLDALGVGHPALSRLVLAARTTRCIRRQAYRSGWRGMHGRTRSQRTQATGCQGNRGVQCTGDRDRYRHRRCTKGEACLTA